MKVKILKCTNPNYWYNSAVGQDIKSLGITEEGEALIDPKIVALIDGEDEEGAGYIDRGDFVIIQEDNVQPKIKTS